MEELERTYLAKELPADLSDSTSKEMLDIYVPLSSQHPDLRIRRRGDKYEITRKRPILEGDSSRQMETSITLDAEEFKDLSQAPGKRVGKRRYQYQYDNHKYEIDVFTGELTGLVLIDIEFPTVEEKDAFVAPDFCLAEVTQEKFLAGGMLCGKRYEEIEANLRRLGYKKITR